jgi:predicted nucleic acid-binding protein
LFDTDVLIWALRGDRRAAKAIDEAGEREVSIVNYMELLQGARDKRETGLIRSFLTDLRFTVLSLSATIGHRAAVYVEEYALRSGLKMADALVAATAVEAQRLLITANVKHFRPISELKIKQFRPS